MRRCVAAANLMLTLAIPASSALLTADAGGSLASVAGTGPCPKAIYNMNKYHDASCREIKHSEPWEDQCDATFKMEVPGHPGSALYKTYECKDGAVRSLVSTAAEGSQAPLRSSHFWISKNLEDLASGRCLGIAGGGSLRFSPPPPAHLMELLRQCDGPGAMAGQLARTFPISVTRHSDVACRVSSDDGVHLLKKEVGTCIDTTTADGRRYGQKYQCEGNAIVAKTYANYNLCTGKEIVNGTVWSYPRWKRFVTGDCVEFRDKDGSKFSARMWSPLSKVAIAEIEDTDCGKPVAEVRKYMGSDCEEHTRVGTQEIIMTAEALGCYRMTNNDQLTSMHVCKTTEGSAVSLDPWRVREYSTEMCGGGTVADYELSTEQFGRLKGGSCVRTANAVDGRSVYLKVTLPEDAVQGKKHPFAEADFPECEDEDTPPTTPASAAA